MNFFIEGMLAILKDPLVREDTKIQNTIEELELMKESNEKLLKEVA